MPKFRRVERACRRVLADACEKAAKHRDSCQRPRSCPSVRTGRGRGERQNTARGARRRRNAGSKERREALAGQSSEKQETQAFQSESCQIKLTLLKLERPRRGLRTTNKRPFCGIPEESPRDSTSRAAQAPCLCHTQRSPRVEEYINAARYRQKAARHRQSPPFCRRTPSRHANRRPAARPACRAGGLKAAAEPLP